MTLKELKQAVGIPKENIHYKVLRKSEDVFLRVQTESEAWITVLESGYIIYQTGERLTCFPITKCGDYTYSFSDGSTSVISEEEFDHCDWMIRVILEGDKRIAENIEKEARNNTFGESQGDSQETRRTIESFKDELFVDPSPTLEESAIYEIDMKHLRASLDSLVPRQKEFAEKYYLQGKSYQEIAKEWGCSVKAVRNVKYRLQEVLRWEWDNYSKN